MLIDMFSGAGGLTEGFLRNNYTFASHIEMDGSASKTLETRLFYYTLKNNNQEKDYYDYLNEKITRDELIDNNKDLLSPLSSTVMNQEINNVTEKSLINQIHTNMKDYGVKEIDGIIGGPPCQAYSVAGRGRSPDCMENDSRNYLYYHYINFLKEFKPNFFVFENVPGMLSAKNKKIFRDFMNKIKSLETDYVIESDILKANNFNVLQSRRRLIVIGHVNDEQFFKPIFESEHNNGYLVHDVLDDLPKLEPGDGTDSPQKYNFKPSNYLKKFNLRTSKDVLIEHRARKHNPRDREIYRRVINAWDDNKRRIRYDDLPEDLKTHKNRKSFVDRFKVVAGDLPYSHTIMAHLAKDGHYFIHPDIDQARSLTVREAARLQSFPDNYKFEGYMTSQFKQVGNAVPPLMAESIAKNIAKLY